MTTLKKWLADQRKALRKEARYLKIVERLQRRFPDLAADLPQGRSFRSSLVNQCANDFRFSCHEDSGQVYGWVWYALNRWDKLLRHPVSILTVCPPPKVYQFGVWDGKRLQESSTWQEEMRQDKIPRKLINKLRRRVLQEYPA